jgi:hypothetical protein
MDFQLQASLICECFTCVDDCVKMSSFVLLLIYIEQFIQSIIPCWRTTERLPTMLAAVE